MTITLPPVCDRAAARALYPDIRDAIGAEALTLDASQVERAGQAMLQLLVSAAGSEAGIALRRPSRELRDAIGMAGLSNVLAVEIEAGASR